MNFHETVPYQQPPTSYHHYIARLFLVHNILNLPLGFPLATFLDPAGVSWPISQKHQSLTAFTSQLLLNSTSQAPGLGEQAMSGQSLWVLTNLLIIQMAQIMLNSLCSLSFYRVLTWILFTFSGQMRKSFLHPGGKGWYASGSLPAVGSWAVHRYVGPLAGIKLLRLLCQTASHLHNKIKNV